MTGWILAVLALFFLQTLLPAMIQFYGGRGSMRAKIDQAMGPRDTVPEPSVHGQRAKRALNNMFEALPVFLTLALLIQIDPRHLALGQTGAAIFLGARIAYVACYVGGTHGWRTLCWLIAWAGMLSMLAAVLLPS